MKKGNDVKVAKEVETENVKKNTKKVETKTEKTVEKKKVEKKKTDAKNDKKNEKNKAVVKDTKKKQYIADSKKTKKVKKENIFKRVMKYFKGVSQEARRIRWTDKKDLLKYSVCTVLFVLFFGIYFYAIDWIVLLVRSLAK